MISVVIPARNERGNLERLLPRLQNLKSTSPVEVIVVLSRDTSDGSERIEDIPATQILRCKGQGRAIQMNVGVVSSQGDILVFLHADVTPPETFFLDIEDAIASGFEAGFFSYRFDKEDFFLKLNAKFTARDGIFTGGGDQCLFIKKTTFLALEGFNEKQILMEDFEFFKRMKKNKVRYRIIKKDLIVSARKYQHNSYLRVNASNLLLVVLFKLGYPASKLKVLHGKLLKTPY